MKQKLTNGQVLLIRALAQKREEIVSALKELAEAEQDQFRLLVKYYDLSEDKTYVLTQEGEEVFLVEKEEEQKGDK